MFLSSAVKHLSSKRIASSSSLKSVLNPVCFRRNISSNYPSATVSTLSLRRSEFFSSNSVSINLIRKISLYSTSASSTMSANSNTSPNPLSEGFNDPSLFALDSASFLSSASHLSSFEVLNVIGTLPDMQANETRQAIDLASEAFETYSKTTARQRKELLNRWHNLIAENQNDLARMISLESGKPLKEAMGEVAYGNSFIDWFAAETLRADGETIPTLAANQRIITIRQPVGVVGIVTPWNFPTAMITRKVGAALAAGCTTVIKPAAETPYSSIALANLAYRAGFPKGAISIVPTSAANVKEVGLELTTNSKVKKISFTGSTAVGKILMAQSSSTVKKTSMELGGNAPFVVFEDANIADAVTGLMVAKFRNSGQTCVCANRVFVHSSIYDNFANALAERIASDLIVGNGLEPGVTMGPLISPVAVEKMSVLINDAVSKGADVFYGNDSNSLHKNKDSSIPLNSGYFFNPVILKNVTPEMECYKNEIFGPIAALVKFDSEEHLLNLVNSNINVGLGGYLYTNDIGRIMRVSEGIEVGMIGVNTGLFSSEISPFGGVKESGIGREGSKHGISEYLNIKAITINY
ncbi:putative succinate-semialdehyde dehydrogenase [Smittium culicis]|uniref:Succinate-semialdehyde dehydrogenase, mitochondrial n=2 Tax=Smittium culicis TaxID=133412 RepID=A0A1R1XHI5_9FUNG|nr:putative succinate-semialdehyde dehydrogenase [Smittium culicis]